MRWRGNGYWAVGKKEEQGEREREWEGMKGRERDREYNDSARSGTSRCALARCIILAAGLHKI